MEEIKVKLIRKDRGLCREYYQNIKTKKYYAKEEHSDNWYTTSGTFGEPDCPLKKDLKITIIK